MSAEKDKPEVVHTCVVCATVPQDWTFGKCGHIVCASCCHRMRVLYKDTSCVMCKSDLPSVVVIPAELYNKELDFDEAIKRFPRLVSDPATNMKFVERSRMDFFRNLRKATCPSCKEGSNSSAVFGNLNQLRAHAKLKHNSVFCDICLSYEKRYISEMTVYPLDRQKRWSTALRKHIRTTHPICQFCKKHFFDDDMLYDHLVKNHETCSICARVGRQHEYYRNFAELEKHYRDEHFVCDDLSCRGQVFGTILDLQSHNVRVHGKSRTGSSENGSRSRITIDISELHNRQSRPGSNSRQHDGYPSAGRREFSAENVVFSGTDGVAISRTRDSNDTAVRRRSSVSRVGTVGSTDNRRREGPDAPLLPEGRRLREAGNSKLADQRRTHQHPRDAGSSATASQQNKSRQGGSSEVSSEEVGYRSLAPPDSDEENIVRNRTLMKQMQAQLDPASYETFKAARRGYTSGATSAEKFYEATVEAFGMRTSENKILPELIALLPSEQLRTDLEKETVSRAQARDSFPRRNLPPVYTRDGAFPSLPNVPGTRRAIPARTIPVRAPRKDDFPSLVSTTGRPARKAQESQVGRPLIGSTKIPSMRQIFGAPPPAGPSPVQPQAVQPQVTSKFPPLQGNRTTASSTLRGDGGVASSNEGSWTLKQKTNGKRRRDAGPQVHSTAQPAAVTPTPALSSSASAFPPLSTSRTDSEKVISPSNGRRKSAGLDLKRDMGQRREKSSKSSLPKIGGSGYGFAWERQKLRTFKRQVKNSRDGNTASSVGAPKGKYEDYLKSANLDNGAPNLSGGEEPTPGASPSLNGATAAESGEQKCEGSAASSGELDDFSYLKPKVTPGDKAASSFFGS